MQAPRDGRPIYAHFCLDGVPSSDDLGHDLRLSSSRCFRGLLAISITMDVYKHVVHDTQREGISHMDRLLKRRLPAAWEATAVKYCRQGPTTSGFPEVVGP